MKIELIGLCPHCNANWITPQECGERFGHSSLAVACVSCCCMGDEEMEEDA